MFLPLYDSNPLHRIPFQYVTVTIIGLCAAVFLWQQSLSPTSAQQAVLGLGVIPAVIFGNAELAPDLVLVPDFLTLITSMFMHGGWMHLIGNMLFLWVLGDNVEDAMGHMRFVAFYTVCGVVAALAHAGLDPGSQTPMIGASGAISGVIGAYILLHPKASIHTLVFSFVVAIPAWILLGMWIGLQVLNVVTGAGGNVAWWAHIGGAVAGIILIPLFKHRDVPLFDGPSSKVLNEMGATQKVTSVIASKPKKRLPRGITITPVARKARRPWR